MEYTYIIIDSDATSSLQFQHYLEDYGDFVFYGLAKDSDQGLNIILKHLPDVVFINLDKNATECFELVNELYKYVTAMPMIIGMSKSKDYAYEALKNNFFDYWLLPYNELDILKTLMYLKKQVPKEKTVPTICIKSYSDFQYLNTDEILYLKADNNATDFIMKDGRVVSAFKTLKTFEDNLPKNFIRVHQSYILNMDYVSRINYGKSICALKVGQEQLPFSKSYKKNIDSLKKVLAKSTFSTLN
ncbi:DNA-binding LytR/AlgR family response regulator [Saonia flava]|uniref:DNA-binding LytR/AlgR family response regulator n=1 Tax=Saonia flava TaxID=523696 RepID=A0A846QQY5_9FLAO|nr:LytTR family DNA-binding domain-containing protein [Saonia flava]NJB69587.1 DNA-binding LytR/AlgR family response regulator [Saonia flava]